MTCPGRTRHEETPVLPRLPLRAVLSIAVRTIVVWAVAGVLCCQLSAQSGTATLSGVVTDQSGALISDALVIITDQDTGAWSQWRTNKAGIYDIPALSPGHYHLVVSREGFKQVDVRGITLNVQDTVSRNFTLEIGGTSETVQVDGSGVNVNTTNADVSTVIDRQFVENMPMNGRSFQSLMLLSPGVLTATPQGGAMGQYSVNGQRSDSNNYVVDGASGSNQPYIYNSGPASAGMTPNASVLGTTQSMLPVDALEEFRLTTSTYSAEFGRQPGAQVSYRSRSGTNAYHGSLYDYLRNTDLDANNWFNTFTTRPVPTPVEHQNDFGGVLGGPINLERLTDRDRAFFFVNYEGLRLIQAQAVNVYYVPSNGTNNTATYANPQLKNLRANSPPPVQAVLEAWPQPNCTPALYAQCIDYGDGLSPYLFTGLPVNDSLDSVGGRIDVQASRSLRVFARYGDTISRQLIHASQSGTGPGPDVDQQEYRTRALLIGADSSARQDITNELRLQYSPTSAIDTRAPDPAVMTQPLNLDTMQGVPPGGEIYFLLEGSAHDSIIYQLINGTRQFQPNVTDAVSIIHGQHLFKTGVDYRQTTSYLGDGYMSRSPEIFYGFTPSGLLSNTASVPVYNFLRQDPTTRNLGLYLQDEWHVRPRVSLSMGLRWDVNPPPSISGAPMYTYTGDINNPAGLALSKLGAPLFPTTYTNFGPRFGAAVVLRDAPGHETVLRGGAGLFYDTVSLYVTIGAGYAVGAGAQTVYSDLPKTFPLPLSDIYLPPSVHPPYNFLDYPANDIAPPSTVQWNASLEQSLGQRHSLTVGLVGSQAMNLETFREYSVGKLNLNFGTVELYQNGPGSNYNSLQVQYKRQPLHGLQTLASYTWSHAIDSESSENYSAYLPIVRGNSAQDVRHNFTAAFVYSLPNTYVDRWQRETLGGWNLNLWLVARSAFPVEQTGTNFTDPATGQIYAGELNYNGQNPYVRMSGAPGGRQFNPAVFSVPTVEEANIGDAPRNFLRGFGASQGDFAVQRTFPVREQLHLFFRAEAFNVTNHPNFGSINASCGTGTAGAACSNSIMGQATNSLNNAIGTVSPLYQQGGPRSLQFALKLQY